MTASHLHQSERKRARGREPWSEKNIRVAYDDQRPARLAFADPPYPHQSERHYGDHQDNAGEVDHEALITRLCDEFDGWALCTGAYMAGTVLRLCPRGTRQLIWRKPSASFKPGVSVSFQYEPVFIYAGRRRPPARDDPAGRLRCPGRLRRRQRHPPRRQARAVLQRTSLRRSALAPSSATRSRTSSRAPAP